MKSKVKLRTNIIFTLGIMFALVPILTSNPFSNMDNVKNSVRQNNEFNIDKDNLKFSKISEKIHIDNHDPSRNWAVAKAAGICTGSGTYSDPYVIEDLVIDGGGLGTCIWIKNSFPPFRIENCTVFNSGYSSSNAGIKLSYAHHCQLIGNYCLNNTVGIWIYYSEVEIRGNTANNCSRGIYIYNIRPSSDVIVTGNTANNNSEAGIYVEYSDNTMLTENTIINNYNGLYLTRSDDNQILGNIVSNNNNHGISLYLSNFNTIYENDACHNLYGLFAQSSYYNTFERNNASNTTEAGISFTYSDSNDILDNNVSNNTCGIELYGSDHNYISRNIIYNNIRGIYLSSSDYTVVTRNLFGGNNVCIAEINCVENEFSSNGSCTYGQSDEEDISLDLLISSLSILGGIAIILALFLSDIKKRKRKIK